MQSALVCLHWAFTALLDIGRYWKMWNTLLILAVPSLNHSTGWLYSARLISVQLVLPKISGMSEAVKEQWITGLSTPLSSLYPRWVSHLSSPPTAVCAFQITLLWSRQEWNEGCGGEGRKLGGSGLYVGIQWVGASLTDGVTASRDTRLYTQCFWGGWEFLFPWHLKQHGTEGCVCAVLVSWCMGLLRWQQSIAQTGTNGHHSAERNISFPLEPNVSRVSTSCGVHEIKTSDVYEVLYNTGANIYF